MVSVSQRVALRAMSSLEPGGSIFALALTAKCGGLAYDFIAEVPHGTPVSALSRAICTDVPGAPPDASLTVMRTGQLLAPDAVLTDCDLRSGDTVTLRTPPPTVPITLKGRASHDSPLAAADVQLRRRQQPRGARNGHERAVRDAAPGGDVVRVRMRGTVTGLPTGTFVIGLDASVWEHTAPPSTAPAFELQVTEDELTVRAALGGPSLSVDGTVVGDRWHPILRLPARLRAAGGAEFRLERIDGAGGIGAARLIIGDQLEGRRRVDLGVGGDVEFNRPPRLASPTRTERITMPAPPDAPRRLRIPYPIIVVPLLLGGVLVLILPSGTSMFLIAFMALSPIMALATYFGDKRSGRKEYKAAAERFEHDLVQTEAALTAAVSDEARQRRSESPDAPALVRRATQGDSHLWERRSWDSDFLSLRVGLARLDARTAVAGPRHGAKSDPRVDDLTARFSNVDDVPLLIALGSMSVVGLAGSRVSSVSVARSLMVQAATLHSHSELGIAAALAPGSDRTWGWLKWLPHTASGASLLQGPSVGMGHRGRDLLERIRRHQVTRLEEMAAAHQKAPDGPSLLILIDDQLALERSLVADLLNNAARLSMSVIWIGGDPRGLPGQCRVTIDTDEHMRARLIEIDSAVERSDVRAEGLGTAACEEVARALAPLRDTGGRSVSASIPTHVRLLERLDLLQPSALQLAEVWQRPARGLGAVLGVSFGEDMTFDLRGKEGPHGLIVGTTGAGKSELLRTLVMSLAARHPPTRLNFLLFDYKGGAAFEPCRGLPHVLDVVSDLDAELGDRALQALRGEIRRREVILAEAKASNLRDLERLAPHLAPPSLLIAIDEFAALQDVVPDFVDRVIDIAQRGRTLGVHMILASQQLRTAFSSAVRANSNLRIALRVKGDTESEDVIEANDAARIAPARLGRAFARVGSEPLIEFQTAHVSGRFVDPRAAEVQLRPFHTETPLLASARRSAGSDEGVPADETDMAAIVRAAVAASELLDLPTPRPVWEPPLPERLSRQEVQHASDLSVGRCAVGRVDDPTGQRQYELTFDLDEGHVVALGAGGSGKTTLLHTVAASAAWASSPEQLRIYAIDGSSGPLRCLLDLPHCAAVGAMSSPETVVRILDRLDGYVRDRTTRFADVGCRTLTAFNARADVEPLPRVLVLIDGMDRFEDAFRDTRGHSPFERLAPVIPHLRAVGVHLVVTADRRGSMRTSVLSQFAQRIALRPTNPEELTDYGVSSRLASELKLGPGRCVLQGGMFAQIAAPDPAPGADVTEGFARLATHLSDVWPGVAAPQIRRLPDVVLLSTMLGVAPQPKAVPIGRGGPELEVQTIDVANRHCLIAGANESGRSNALGVVALQLARLPTVDAIHLFAPRISPLVQLNLWTSKALGEGACAEALAELATSVRALPHVSGPTTIVCLDDSGLFHDARTAQALEVIVNAGRDRGVRVIAASEISGSRMRSPWLMNLKRDRQGLLLMASNAESDILGVQLPQYMPIPMVRGRAFLVDGNKAVITQVAALDEDNVRNPVAEDRDVAPRRHVIG